MFETHRAKDQRILLELSMFLLLFGLSLGHFSIVFLDGHQVFEKNFIHLVIAILFSIFTVILLLRNWYSNLKSIINWLFLIPVVITLFETIVLFVKSGFLPEQIVEHALKILLPIVGICALNHQVVPSKIFWGMKMLVACTFLGHGIFAIGWHYVPGNFILMTTTILEINASSAEKFLFVIGVLDILAAILIFSRGIPQKLALWYMIIWGLLTSISRFLYGSMIELEGVHLLYYVANTIYRLPHGLIPLYILMKTYSPGFIVVNKKSVVI